MSLDDTINTIVQHVQQTRPKDSDMDAATDDAAPPPGPTRLLNKSDAMLLNNGWNDKNERIIVSIGENAASYKWMHEKSAHLYSVFHQVLSVVLVVFNTVLTAETMLPTDADGSTASIVRRVFIYAVTILSVVNNFLKFQQLSAQHTHASSQFSQLYHEIQQQMSMYRRDRPNAVKYISDTLKLYDNLVIAGPDINSFILNKFKATFNSSDIALPAIADKIQKIEIITETTPSLASVVPRGKASHLEALNCFAIEGDITDEDVHSSSEIELRELRSRFLRERSQFEIERYRAHEFKDDASNTE